MLILQARKLLLLSQSALASFEKAAPSVLTFSVLFRTNYDALFRLIITLLLLLLFFAVYVVIHQSHYVLHEFGDIDVFFGTRLKVHESVFIRDLDRFALEHGPLAALLRIGQVDLVSHQHLGHRGVGRISVYGVDPRAHVLKRLPLSQVERDDHALRMPVELLRDRVKPLLARRVPNLHIHFGMLVPRVRGLYAVDTQRLDVRLLELVVAEAIFEEGYAEGV